MRGFRKTSCRKVYRNDRGGRASTNCSLRLTEEGMVDGRLQRTKWSYDTQTARPPTDKADTANEVARRAAMNEGR